MFRAVIHISGRKAPDALHADIAQFTNCIQDLKRHWNLEEQALVMQGGYAFNDGESTTVKAMMVTFLTIKMRTMK